MGVNVTDETLCRLSNVTIQQGEILLHYDMIAVKSHAEPQRLLSRKGGDF